MLKLVATFDLARPLPPVFVDWRYSHVHATFTWGLLPLGDAQIQAPENRRLAPGALRQAALDNLGWEIWERHVTGALDVYPARKPAISVIVCTRDRPLSLERCLEALAAIDYPDFEVLVVDNGSTDPAVGRVIARCAVAHVHEERQGLDWARNSGIRASRHDLIAFIDDDAIASSGWLLGIARGFEDPEVSAVTGMVLPAELETQAQLDFERYGGMSKGFNEFTVRREELSRTERYWSSSWGVGTNMAFRRALFDQIGDFDVALDAGTPTHGAGDIEFLERLVSAGHVLRYQPMAMIRHVHRRDSKALIRQIYDNGRSFAAYLMTVVRRSPSERGAVLRFATRDWIGRWLLGRLFRGVVHRDRETLRLAYTEIRGCLSSIRAYRQSRRIAEKLLGSGAP